jgi:dihydrofolate reductase
MISIIAAMANNNVIGVSSHNKMPWHLPADLKYFREKTLYKPVIMGRKTFESLGKQLPSRINLVLSHDINYTEHHYFTHPTLEDAIMEAERMSDKEIMVIGGGSVYRQALPIVNRMYITKIHADIEGDVYFPNWDENEWILISQEDYLADDRNKFDYSFYIFEKVSK